MLAEGNVAVTFKPTTDEDGNPTPLTYCDHEEDGEGKPYCVTLAGYLQKGMSFELDLDAAEAKFILEPQGCNIRVEKQGHFLSAAVFEILAHILANVACQRFLLDYVYDKVNSAL